MTLSLSLLSHLKYPLKKGCKKKKKMESLKKDTIIFLSTSGLWGNWDWRGKIIQKKIPVFFSIERVVWQGVQDPSTLLQNDHAMTTKKKERK